MSTTCPEHRAKAQRGFSIVAAIFILVVLSALAGFIVSTTATQNLDLAKDFQSARALQAARTGIEWGVAGWLNGGSCSGGSAYAGTPPTCSPGGAAATCTQQTLYTPSGTNPTGLTDFTVVVALCRCPAPPAGGTCQIVATASAGTAGSSAYIERQLAAVVEGN